MARFYGTVQGNRGSASRLGHYSLSVDARSYAGSVIVRMSVHDDVDFVFIGLGVGSTSQHSTRLYYGPVADLFNDTKRNVIVEAFAREAPAKQAGETP